MDYARVGHANRVAVMEELGLIQVAKTINIYSLDEVRMTRDSMSNDTKT